MINTSASGVFCSSKYAEQLTERGKKIKKTNFNIRTTNSNTSSVGGIYIEINLRARKREFKLFIVPNLLFHFIAGRSF